LLSMTMRERLIAIFERLPEESQRETLAWARGALARESSGRRNPAERTGQRDRDGGRPSLETGSGTPRGGCQ